MCNKDIIRVYCYDNSLLDGQFCTDSVDIDRSGSRNMGDDKQAIIPQFNFACSGIITGIRARMRFDDDGVNYPIIQVWRPVSIGSMIYNKTGEVQLMSSDQGTGEDRYRLVTIILTGNNTIEVQPGDVVGYYHPPQSRYRVRTRNIDGYTIYQFEGSPNLTSVNLRSANSNYDRRQPLIQFSIGKWVFKVMFFKITHTTYIHTYVCISQINYISSTCLDIALFTLMQSPTMEWILSQRIRDPLLDYMLEWLFIHSLCK